MKTIEVSHATRPLAEYARDAEHETLILTDGGTAIAAIVPVDDLKLEELALSASPEFLAIIRKARTQRRAGLGVSPDEARRELGL